MKRNVFLKTSKRKDFRIQYVGREPNEFQLWHESI